MNVYAIIILATLLVDYGLNLVADMLNLRALRPDLPAAFQDVYAAETYRQSQAYTRVQTQFGWVTATFSLLVTLIFWFAGGFPALDRIVRAWACLAWFKGVGRPKDSSPPPGVDYDLWLGPAPKRAFNPARQSKLFPVHFMLKSMWKMAR